MSNKPFLPRQALKERCIKMYISAFPQRERLKCYIVRLSANCSSSHHARKYQGLLPLFACLLSGRRDTWCPRRGWCRRWLPNRLHRALRRPVRQGNPSRDHRKHLQILRRVRWARFPSHRTSSERSLRLQGRLCAVSCR